MKQVVITRGMVILGYSDVPIWGIVTKYGYSLFEKYIKTTEFG